MLEFKYLAAFIILIILLLIYTLISTLKIFKHPLTKGQVAEFFITTSLFVLLFGFVRPNLLGSSNEERNQFLILGTLFWVNLYFLTVIATNQLSSHGSVLKGSGDTEHSYKIMNIDTLE